MITPLSMQTKRQVCDYLSSFLCVSIFHQVFPGNQEAYETKKNIFFPPVVGRFIRLHPINWYNKATIRMEFYGCELDGKMGLFVWVDVGKTYHKSIKNLDLTSLHSLLKLLLLLNHGLGLYLILTGCNFICDIWTTMESSKTFCSLF